LETFQAQAARRHSRGALSFVRVNDGRVLWRKEGADWLVCISAGCSRYWYTTSEMFRRRRMRARESSYECTVLPCFTNQAHKKTATTCTHDTHRQMTTDVPDYASCIDVPPSECKLRIAPADLSSRNVRSRQGRIGCASFCCCMWSVAGKASSKHIPPRIVALLEKRLLR
jgi:hypothetical protein